MSYYFSSELNKRFIKFFVFVSFRSNHCIDKAIISNDQRVNIVLIIFSSWLSEYSFLFHSSFSIYFSSLKMIESLLRIHSENRSTVAVEIYFPLCKSKMWMCWSWMRSNSSYQWEVTALDSMASNVMCTFGYSVVMGTSFKIYNYVNAYYMMHSLFINKCILESSITLFFECISLVNKIIVVY